MIDKRRKIMSAFDVVRHRNVDMIKAFKEKRMQLRDGVDTDDLSTKDQDLVEVSYSYLMELYGKEKGRGIILSKSY